MILGIVILVAVYADMAQEARRLTGGAQEERVTHAQEVRGPDGGGRSALALGVAACGDDDSGGGGSSGGGGGGDEPYIAIVSKGFQHQFWQAVKQGAEEEAKAEGARITFEGPPTEQDIEQQVTMLTNALTEEPGRDRLRRARLQGERAADGPGEVAEHPGHRVRLRRRQRRPGHHGGDRQQGRRGRGGQAPGRADRQQGQGRRDRPRPDQPLRHRPPRRLPRVDEGERPGHRGAAGPVRRRRPGEVGRHREVDHLREPGPQGLLRRQRGLGDRRHQGRPGERQEGHHDRRLRLRQGPDRRHQQRR